jgi:hypothetical protein|tara:strand:- start:97 stop:633 length:537 start_codon:yes stop_codon:yes gene_type:complete
MAKVETDVYTFKDDVGKNLYRSKKYYTLVVEQDVLAKDKDEADQKFLDHGGLDHSKIIKDLAQTSDGVETYIVDANYADSDTTKYIGKVKYDTDSYNQSLEEAIENEDIHIDTWADENEPHQLTKIKLVMTPEEEDKNANIVRDKDGNAVAVESMYGTKEESDVDVSLNLQAESQRGK